MSRRPWIVVSSIPIRKKSPKGMATPAIRAIPRIKVGWGDTGTGLPSATSMVRELLSAMA